MEFKEFSKKDFEKMLPHGFMEYDDPTSEEYVYTIPIKPKFISIRVYSSVSKNTGNSRSCGRDAIRIIAWDNVKNRPAAGATKRINRVFGNVTSISDRMKSRIDEILRSINVNYDENTPIHDWNYINKILKITARNNKFAADLLKGLKEYQVLTENQLAYVLGDKAPNGFPTMESKLIDRYGENADLWEDLCRQEDESKKLKYLDFVKRKYAVDDDVVDYSSIDKQYDSGLINREDYLIMKQDKDREFYKKRNKRGRHK